MARQVRVRRVCVEVGDPVSLEDNERIARVEWNGRRKCYLIIIQDPAPPTPKLTARKDAVATSNSVLSDRRGMIDEDTSCRTGRM